MRRFIKRVLLFLTMAAAVPIAFCVIELFAEVRVYRRDVVAPAGADVLICADSKTEMGLSSDVWPKLFNFSMSGRTMDQTYMTAKDVLEANGSRFKVLLIDVSPESACMDYTQPLKDCRGSCYFLLHALHPAINTRSWRGFIGVFRDLMVEDRLNAVSKAIRGKRRFYSSLYSRSRNHGRSLKLCDPAQFKRTLDALCRTTQGVLRDPGAHGLYFDWVARVIDLAREHGVEPVLLVTPWCVDMRGRAGPSNVRRYIDFVGGFAERRGCRFLNLMEWECRDECWRDANHLNLNGMRPFTDAVRNFVDKRVVAK